MRGELGRTTLPAGLKDIATGVTFGLEVRAKGGAMRRLIVVATAVLATLVVAAPAHAQQGFGGICEFPITIEEERGGQRFHALPPEAAPFVGIISGQWFGRVTNVATGESVVVNASGPIFVADDHLIARGQTLFSFSESENVAGDIPAGVFLTSGPVFVALDDAGSVVSTRVLGGTTRRDICAELVT